MNRVTRHKAPAGLALALLGIVLIATPAAALIESRPTIVAFSGPVGVTRGQTAQMKCQNNFALAGARLRLTLLDADGHVLVGGDKVVDVPFHTLASLELNVDEIFPDLLPGQRLELVARLEIAVRGGLAGLMEEEGLVPGASLEVFDTASGRTTVLIGLIRIRTGAHAGTTD